MRNQTRVPERRNRRGGRPELRRAPFRFLSCSANALTPACFACLESPPIPLFFFLCLCVLQDVETIQSLGEALTKFDGACVIVSHDEKLLRVACTQLWHCDGEGGVTQLHYGFDEYKKRLREGSSLTGPSGR